MSETERVQRWREAKRQKGLKACTVWLTPQEELRLKDLAAQRRCSPSEIIQEALAQFSSVSQPNFSNSADTELLREMIREEVGALQGVSASATATITDIEQIRALIQEELAHVPPVTALVTATVTDTVAATLPALVRAIVEDLALEAFGMSVTATDNSYETDTEDPEETHEALYDDDTVTNGNVADTETPALHPTTARASEVGSVTATGNSDVTHTSTPEATPEAPLRRGGLKLTPRQGKALRAKRARGVPVKELMEEYGVSKATVFRYLAEG